MMIEKLNELYKEILSLGLLELRNVSYEGDVAFWKIQSEMLHNLPGLIGNRHAHSHIYYWRSERKMYIEKLNQLGNQDYIDACRRYYESCWDEIGEILAPYINREDELKANKGRGAYDDLKVRVSHALRHSPETYEVSLDHRGFTKIDELLVFLRRMHYDWRDLTVNDLESMINADEYPEFELQGGLIRALYDHHVKVDLSGNEQRCENLLYFGVHEDDFYKVMHTGMPPEGLAYFPLSVDIKYARQRLDGQIGELRVLEIDTGDKTIINANDRVWQIKNLQDCVARSL